MNIQTSLQLLAAATVLLLGGGVPPPLDGVGVKAASPISAHALSVAILVTARQGEAAAQTRGLSPGARLVSVEAAILGVVAESGATPSVILAALRLAQAASSDPLLRQALGAAMGRLAQVSNGCAGCTMPLPIVAGSQAGGAGTPAYSYRAPL